MQQIPTKTKVKKSLLKIQILYLMYRLGSRYIHIIQALKNFKINLDTRLLEYP